MHGGAWLSGSSWDVEPYLRILAAEGFTAVGLNYTLAPEAAYPVAVRELNDALAHLVERADELGIDADRIVLAGDSAGAQLAAQLAALTTGRDYASLVGIRPALRSEQLRAVVLNCGVYDLHALADLTGLLGWGFKTAMWAYSGTKDWSASPAGHTMSTVRHVTGDFPPTYISARQRRRADRDAVGSDGGGPPRGGRGRDGALLAGRPRAGPAARVPVPPRLPGGRTMRSPRRSRSCARGTAE
ncbi:alpha/beta hydrolase [Leifsonia sp. L25]|uniref:alpha/beta hydrolase n=1 Tax=Leifsonia sp. L25 TaxID=3423957 RepID=UPI003D68A2EB